MIDLSAAVVLWLRAFHIIAVIAWMAGMLYLPRLYVYHCEAGPGTDASERFKVMERRLLRAIINPAMIAALVLGIALALALDTAVWSAGWIYAKFALVIALFVLHGFLSRWRRDFARDRNTRTAKFYRIVNEVPTVLMVGIVIFAIVKPF